MSRIVRFHHTGGPEVLQLDDLDVPAPQRDEVRIAVRAIGLNRAEAMFRAGQYIEEPRLPGRLGYEASGTIEAVGPGVEGLQVGDRVSVIPAFSMNDYAMYGELVLAPARAVVKHPASLSWEEAAAVWMQYTTAYGALIDIAGLSGGEDQSRASTGFAVANLGVARRSALNLLRQDDTPGRSIKRKQRRAAFDHSYLESLLNF